MKLRQTDVESKTVETAEETGARPPEASTEATQLQELAAMLSMSSLLEFWDNPEDDAAWAEYQ